MMARSDDAHHARPKIRLQSDPRVPIRGRHPALRACQGPSAACGGALRAALTRARAACAAAMRRRRGLRRDRRTDNTTVLLSLDGGVQIHPASILIGSEFLYAAGAGGKTWELQVIR